MYTFNFDSPVRAVDFSVGDKLAVITTDPFMEHSSSIQVKRIARDISDRKSFLPYLILITSPLCFNCSLSLLDMLEMQSK